MCPFGVIMGDWVVGSDAQKMAGAPAGLSPTSDNTKSGYVEVCAALDFDVGALILHQVTGYSGDYLVDIAVGASGSEFDIISNVLITEGGCRIGCPAVFYINIPKGTRIALRAQQNRIGSGYGGTFYLSWVSKGGKTQAYGIIDTYGASGPTMAPLIMSPSVLMEARSFCS